MLEFVELKLPFLPGKEAKYTHALNYKQNYICKKRDKLATSSLQKTKKNEARVGEIKVYQAIYVSLLFVYYFYYHYHYLNRCTNTGFVDKGYPKPKTIPKNKNKPASCTTQLLR